MQLEITHTTLIKDIQGAFNKAYPNLWIDFYFSFGSNTNQSRPEKIRPDTQLSKLGYMNRSSFIDINADRRVEELEHDLCAILGVKSRLLRKSGNVWVNTSLTGNWSLANQNSKGDQVYNE